MTPDISKDIETAEERGKQAKDAFINDRLKKNENFFAPLTKQKLKTFADISKKASVKATNNKTIEYKQNKKGGLSGWNLEKGTLPEA